MIPAIQMRQPKFREVKNAAHPYSQEAPRPGFRFVWSQPTSWFLCYPVVLKAGAPWCPLNQSKCPGMGPALQQLSPVNFQLQSLWVRAPPLCLLPAPCHGGTVPPVGLSAGVLAANHTCPSFSISSKPTNFGMLSLNYMHKYTLYII